MINEIDIDKIVRERAGKKAKFIPKWCTKLLARIIHQDFINTYLREGREGVDFCKGVVEYVGATVDVEGRENLPDDGRLYTFVCNHPLGAIDGVTLGWVLGEHYDSKIKYLVNDLLMNLPGLAPLCIPINKTGKQSRNFPAMIEAGFKADTHILMFPAGLCSRKRNGKIRDLEWKKTFITKSIETHRDVIPIYFEGHNSNFFYRLSNISDRYVKKVNIAMLFLADEMFKNAGNTFTITFGKPIPWESFTDDKTPMEWAKIVKEQVYQLAP